jgi:hypothetical protein
MPIFKIPPHKNKLIAKLASLILVICCAILFLQATKHRLPYDRNWQLVNSHLVTLYQNSSLQIEVNIEASSYCVFSYFTFRGDELAVNKYIIRGAHPGCSKHQVFMWLVSVDPQVKGDAAITGNYSTINSMPVP